MDHHSYRRDRQSRSPPRGRPSNIKKDCLTKQFLQRVASGDSERFKREKSGRDHHQGHFGRDKQPESSAPQKIDLDRFQAKRTRSDPETTVQAKIVNRIERSSNTQTKPAAAAAAGPSATTQFQSKENKPMSASPSLSIEQYDAKIKEQLSSFESLTTKFVFGQPLVEASGGFHLDKGLQNPRSSLLPAFTGNKSFTFGPLTNSKALVDIPSEGEESEIDITDLLSIGTNSQQSHGAQSSSQQQKPWSVQEAWSQAQTQASSNNLNLSQSIEKLHPHSQKLLNGRIANEEKGGPRMRDILEQLVDLKSLRPIDSLSQLPAEHVYSGQLAVYLTLQGLDHHQKATHISRRLKSWLALYDTSNYASEAAVALDTRPSLIHVYPNQKLANLQKSATQQQQQNSSDHSPPELQRTISGSSAKLDTVCLVQFVDPAALEHVHRVLKDCRSSLLNEAKQPIRFGMAYDSRCLGETEWVGVILRNLPSNATSKGILNNFTQASRAHDYLRDNYTREQLLHDMPYRILELPEPTKIRGQFCTVLTVPDIEEAERICRQWNQFDLDMGQKLKAHLHPYSFRRRPQDKLSLHPLFKERYDPSTISPAPQNNAAQPTDAKSASAVNGATKNDPEQRSPNNRNTKPSQKASPETQPHQGSAKPQATGIKTETGEKPHMRSSRAQESRPVDGSDKRQKTPSAERIPLPINPATAIKGEDALCQKTMSKKGEDAGARNGTEAIKSEEPSKASAAAVDSQTANDVPLPPPPKTGLLALLDHDDDDYKKATYSMLAQQKQQAQSKQVKESAASAALAIMDEVLEEENLDKKKQKRRKQRQLLEKRREREKQLEAQIAQQQQIASVAVVGKKRQREDLHQTKLELVSQGSGAKRVKREEVSTASVVKDEQSQGTASAQRRD